MCGIFGAFLTADFWARNTRSVAQIFSEMSEATSYRGPDDAGFWTHVIDSSFKPPFRSPGQFSGQPHVAVGHRRLSIIDTSSAGWQPMVSGDQSLVVTFNGEIYNYVELREELQAIGVSFKTKTDTEVLLEGYRVWGQKLLPKLTGMFAFCIVDLPNNEALLVRDPFGIKPLHYSILNNSLIFASEIKALLKFPGMSRVGHRSNIFNYLDCGVLDKDDSTFYEHIKRIGAGCAVRLRLDRPDVFVSSDRYWSVDSIKTQNLTWTDAVDAVRSEFLNSVRLHLRSDVPLGAALSGGVDSSSIVAVMRHLEPQADIRTFSYVADDSSISEERWMDVVTKSQGCQAYKVHANDQELLNDLDDLITTQDEPFGSTSIYAQYRVFRLAKEAGIKVMLDGQGADEIFAGYRPFIIARLSSLFRSGDLFECARLLKAYSQVGGNSYLSLARVVAQLIPNKGRIFLKRRYSKLSGRKRGWLQGKSVEDSRGLSAGDGVLVQQLKEAIKSTSLPGLLRYEDRNSMRFSIESRVPFLTPNFVSLGLSLPESFHVNPEVLSKAVFRAAMRGLVPDVILDRRDKIGFETPDQTWSIVMREHLALELRNETSPIIKEIIDVKRLQYQLEFEPKTFQKFEVWRILNFIKWAKAFCVQ